MSFAADLKRNLLLLFRTKLEGVGQKFLHNSFGRSWPFCISEVLSVCFWSALGIDGCKLVLWSYTHSVTLGLLWFQGDHDPEPRHFGGPVCALTSEKNSVPVVMEKLLEYVEMHGLYTEGIYRKSGSANRMRELKQSLQAGKCMSAAFSEIIVPPIQGDTPWMIFSPLLFGGIWTKRGYLSLLFFTFADPSAVRLENYPIHTITGIFKQWLRELPDPLMTFAQYNDFLRAVGKRLRGESNEPHVNPWINFYLYFFYLNKKENIYICKLQQ